MAQLSNIFDLFPQDVSNRLRRKTFIKLIENEANKRNINLDWVKTGQGEMKKNDQYIIPSVESQVTAVNESQSPYPSPDTLLRKAAKVLRSNSSFCRALDSNIESFHEAIELREDLDIARAELKQCQITLAEQNTLIDRQNEKINQQSQRMDEQYREIEELKAQVKSLNEKLLAVKSA